MRVNLEDLLRNEPILRRALEGDREAVRQYCGSYKLVETVTGRLFRCRGYIPFTFKEVTEIGGVSVYDKDGYLIDKLWSLPRIIDGKEM